MSASQTPIEVLETQETAVTPEDRMGEAARKALLHDFIQMLKNEDGSRAGDDIKSVHDMRVATRRMRSVLMLMDAHFKPKAIRAFQQPLQKVARALGGVRDLDVMIENLTRFQATLPDDQREALQGVVNVLEERRAGARQRLNTELGKGYYKRFRNAFTKFVTTQVNRTKNPHAEGNQPVPVEVRHMLPAVVYSHLASVRAYGSVITQDTNVETLHMLRIALKRLRYLTSMFEDVLGKSGKEFIDELKAVQDHLGKLNDSVVAQANLSDLLPSLDEMQAA